MDLIKATLVGIISVKLIPNVLSSIGFTSNGISSNSIASEIQSKLGNVSRKSLFSKAQSAGILGVNKSTKIIVGSFAVLVYLIVSKI